MFPPYYRHTSYRIESDVSKYGGIINGIASHTDAFFEAAIRPTGEKLTLVLYPRE